MKKSLRKSCEGQKNTQRIYLGFLKRTPAQRIRIDPTDRRVIEARSNLSQNLSSIFSMLEALSKHSEELKNVAQRAQDLRVEIDTIFGSLSGNDYATWVEKRDRMVAGHACPIEIGHLLRSRLYEKVPGVGFYLCYSRYQWIFQLF